MTRGFVTIATGKRRYYRIAANLLRSYRFHTEEPMPFALICDRENHYTKEFDQVILLKESCCSYLDKLSLPELAPFDETIFLDADSLAYGDLNGFWQAFEGASDFSAFGWDFPPEYPYAWFRKEDTVNFEEYIHSIPSFIGGVYFLRRTAKLAAFNATCRFIQAHYHMYRFRQFEEPADEPIFALAMSVHGFRTAGEKSMPVCFFPHAVRFEADVLKGTLQFESRYQEGVAADGRMVHWSSGNTYRPPYTTEAFRLNHRDAGKLLVEACCLALRAKYRIKLLIRPLLKLLGLR